jgi:phosphatidylserine/phosphatidylglycerophosphate/cardiolipin synthase-like enzyme
VGEWIRLRPDPWIPAATASTPLLVNCAGRSELGERIVALIDSAQKSVAVISPLLTDERLLGRLVAARQRRVRVQVITELRNNRSDGVWYPTRGFEPSPQGKHLKKHFEAVRALAARRVSCRGLKYYAHPKLVLADDARVVVSSANLEANNLGWGEKVAIEAGVLVEDPPLVSALTGAFRSLWEACPFRLHLAGRDISLQETAAPPPAEGALSPRLPGGFSVAWSYPPDGHGLRDQLAELVRGARARVVVSALSFYHTDQIAGLGTALAEALRRGVAVAVVVRRDEKIPAHKYPDPGTRRLLDLGLRLFGITAQHAKGVLVDRAWCGVTSANVNPFSLDGGLESAHVECGLFGPADSSLLAGLAGFLGRLPETATHAYRP